MNTRQPPTLLDFQIKPAQELLDCCNKFYQTQINKSCLIVMPAGTGKTFVVGEALRRLQEIPFTPPFQHRPARILVITPAAVKTQFTRVLLKFGVKDFLVTSHMSMTTTFGEGYLTWRSYIHQGEIHLEPIWDEDLKPDIIILDESQTVKNPEAQISQIILSAIKQGILVVFVSATPFTTLAETFITCCALRLTQPVQSLHRDNMMGFIANNQDYKEPNAAAMARFKEYLIDQGLIIEAHGIKFKHRVFNKCELVEFDNPEDARIYKKAYDRYVEECAKINKSTPEGWAKIMVEMLIFQQCAEFLKATLLAREAHKAVKEKGKQVIIGTNFRGTIEIIKHKLMVNGKVPEKRISIIIGGQSSEVRQDYIDRFQKGEADYCLVTAKSGGAGLSFHHELETARPREILVPQMWSAIQLVQFLGRGHRINSLSTTRQRIIWFKSTIEEYVAHKVTPKLRSLSKIVSARESFLDLFTPEGFLNVEDSQDILRKLDEESIEDKTEEGDSVIDAMPLDALEEAQDLTE